MTNDRDRVEELFRNACKDGVYPYLYEADAEVVNLVVRPKDASIPKENVLRVYGIREKTNEARSHPIKGFNWLLPSLKNSAASAIRIHQAYAANGREFRIFTDDHLTELVGVLVMGKVQNPGRMAK